MDPLCHTLVGAALGHTGLERRSRYGRATLIIAANLPDIDVVAHFMGGTASYAFRRGITHGLPALVVLPLMLAVLMLVWHRVRDRGKPDANVSFAGLLLLAGIGVLTHPVLDWMNTYGMRWLMPMVDTWFYGDTLFIIDWLVWLTLLAGLVATRWMRPRDLTWIRRPATIALAIVATYILFNFTITRQAERAAMTANANSPPQRVMASPVPFNPLRRMLVMEYPTDYRYATFDVLAGRLSPVERTIERGSPEHIALAADTQDGRWFLHWARFPYSVERLDGGQRHITIADARYVPDLDNPRLDGFAVYRFSVAATADTGPD